MTTTLLFFFSKAEVERSFIIPRFYYNDFSQVAVEVVGDPTAI